ncbi:MAG: hypothetical protein ACREQZ_03555, partial [Woeseiaceae bacterium]
SKVRARLPAEAGALLLKALPAAAESLPVPDVSAEVFGPGPDSQGAAGGPQERTGGDRPQIVVQNLDDGAFRFLRPHGGTFDRPAPERSDGSQLVAAHQAGGIQITPRTAITHWTGENPDYGQAIDWLLPNAERAQNAPAETFRQPATVTGIS